MTHHSLTHSPSTAKDPAMIRLLNTWFPRSLVAAAAGAGLLISTLGGASACDRGRSSYRPVYRPTYAPQYCQNPVQNSLLPYGQGYGPQPQFQQPMPPQVQQLLPQGQPLQLQGQQPLVQGQPGVEQSQ